LNIEHWYFNGERWRTPCRACYKAWRDDYRKCNRQKILEEKRCYREKYKHTIREQRRKFYSNEENRAAKQQHDRQYALANKDKIKKYKLKWEADKRKHDVNFRLRKSISHSIRQALKSRNLSKNKTSITKLLPYSILELRSHLESKFESWMNWDNWGTYNLKTWDDNDSSTWTWQIDHIVAQSKFTFASISDVQLKQCWALDNLRPLSAKNNIHDGNRR
jgi:hypothetical protein